MGLSTKDMKRALRRHHMERMKQKATRLYGGYAAGRPKSIGRLANTRVPCSCYMCGNPRKHFLEITKQEKLADIEARENGLY